MTNVPAQMFCSIRERAPMPFTYTHGMLVQNDAILIVSYKYVANLCFTLCISFETYYSCMLPGRCQVQASMLPRCVCEHIGKPTSSALHMIMRCTFHMNACYNVLCIMCNTYCRSYHTLYLLTHVCDLQTMCSKHKTFQSGVCNVR